MSINLRRKTEDFLTKQNIKRIKYAIFKNHYPPEFNAKKWKNAKNCIFYSYVLDVPIIGAGRQCWLPGSFSKKEFDGKIRNISEALMNLKEDLKVLGFCYRDDDKNLEKGEWRIAIYYIPTPKSMPIALYMVRQDQDGRWSEKRYWNRNAKIIKQKSIIPPDLSQHNMILYKTLIVKKNNNN